MSSNLRFLLLMGLATVLPLALTLGVVFGVGGRSRSVDNLISRGGTVLGDTTTFAIFWRPRGYHFEPSGDDRRYEGLVGRFLRDVSESPYFDVLNQYPTIGSSGAVTWRTAFGGATIDAHPFPPSVTAGRPLSQEEVRSEVRRLVTDLRWPPGLNSIFLLFTPDHVGVCHSETPCSGTSTERCGSHGYMPYGSGAILYYAVLPVAGSACPHVSLARTGDGGIADAQIVALSHQLADVIVNPNGNGWSDTHLRGIAEKCEGAPGIPDRRERGVAVVNLHGSRYSVAQLWSNADGHCVAG